MTPAAVPNWKSVRSLAGLGELTARWLEGNEPEIPGYDGPPDDETVPLVPVLAALNRSGFVTTCSQPGETGPGYDGALWEQRAVVEGFTRPDLMHRINAAASTAGLMVIAYDPQSMPRRRFRSTWAIPATLRAGEPYTWFGTQVPRREICDPEVGYGACHRDAVAAVCHAWQVTVIDFQWGRNGLLWETLERAVRKDAP